MDIGRESHSFPVGKDDQGKRIDRIARKLLHQTPLSTLYRSIRKGHIRVNGQKVSPAYRIKPGDILQIPPSLLDNGREPAPPSQKPTRPDLPILLEDDDFLVLNKPWGIPVHGEHSLLPLVLAYLQGSLPPSLAFAPGPLHRLDRNTTGVLVFGKSLEGARFFSEALRTGRTEKYYLTLLSGCLPSPQRWEHKLDRDPRSRKTREVKMPAGGGKNKDLAVTEAFPLLRSNLLPGGVTLAVVRIYTGKTHQIRAQASAEGFPLLGDVKYGGGKFKGGYLLHAFRLRLPDRLDVSAPLPPRFLQTTRTLFGDSPIHFQGFTIR